jgi:hypothetical protein
MKIGASALEMKGGSSFGAFATNYPANYTAIQSRRQYSLKKSISEIIFTIAPF